MSRSAAAQCWECYQRRLVCDSTRPNCRKCSAKGVQCPGYDAKPLKWMQPGQTRSKGARSKTRLRAEAPSPSEPLTGQQRMAMRRSTTPQDGADTVSPKADSASTGTPETLEIVISPALRDTTYSALLLQGIEYYNVKISPDLVTTGFCGIPNPFYIPPKYASSIPQAMSQTLICAVLGHRVLQTVPGFEQERMALVRTLRSHRGEALRCLAQELSRECSDETWIATLTLLMCEIQHSISPNWWQHVNGGYAMIEARGGIEQFIHTRPKLRALFHLFFLVDIFGSTTSPSVPTYVAHRQLQVLAFLEDLIADGLSTCVPCPIELLREIVLINHQRSLALSEVPLIANGLEEPPAPTSLDSILAFSSKSWGRRMRFKISCIEPSSSPAPSSPTTWDWGRIAQIYQSAAALYCISASPSFLKDDHRSTFWDHRSLLFENLQSLSADKHSHLRKLVLWPLVMLGLAIDSDDVKAQVYVTSELNWASTTLGTASPLVAKDLLEKNWLKGLGGRGARWEQLFDRPYVFGL